MIKGLSNEQYTAISQKAQQAEESIKGLEVSVPMIKTMLTATDGSHAQVDYGTFSTHVYEVQMGVSKLKRLLDLIQEKL